jgi:cell division protein FtsB
MSERYGRLSFRVLLLALWAAAGYHMVFGGRYSVFDVAALEGQRDSATARIDQLIAKTDSLVLRGDSLTEVPAAVERVARERFGLLRDGELLVRFRSRSGENAGDAELDDQGGRL